VLATRWGVDGACLSLYPLAMTGVILAGGRSSRMGINKALIEMNGERLIDRAVRLFREIFPALILVTNDPLLYLDQDLIIVTDIVPGRGPLMGIYTALFFASDDVFVAACDMPFLNGDLIRYMVSQAGEADIVVPRPGAGYEPLHAVYSRRCLKPAGAALARGERKVVSFYKGLRVKVIEGEALAPFGDPGRLFMNINTPEEREGLLGSPS